MGLTKTYSCNICDKHFDGDHGARSKGLYGIRHNLRPEQGVSLKHHTEADQRHICLSCLNSLRQHFEVEDDYRKTHPELFKPASPAHDGKGVASALVAADATT